MKHRVKHLILSFCSIILVGNSYFALADTSSDTEALLNWAEKTFPQFFPSKLLKVLSLGSIDSTQKRESTQV